MDKTEIIPDRFSAMGVKTRERGVSLGDLADDTTTIDLVFAGDPGLARLLETMGCIHIGSLLIHASQCDDIQYIEHLIKRYRTHITEEELNEALSYACNNDSRRTGQTILNYGATRCTNCNWDKYMCAKEFHPILHINTSRVYWSQGQYSSARRPSITLP